MTQLTKVGTVATSTFTQAGITNVVYHNTLVVSFSRGHIILRSGGWETATTKTRMNQVSNQYDLGYRVYRKDFNWFVNYNGETLEFTDGMRLERQ